MEFNSTRARNGQRASSTGWTYRVRRLGLIDGKELSKSMDNTQGKKAKKKPYKEQIKKVNTRYS